MEEENAKNRGGKRDHHHREKYTAYDRALIAAKNTGHRATFEMATGDLFTGIICSVDKFNIEIRVVGGDGEDHGKAWLAKSMICVTRIHSNA